MSRGICDGPQNPWVTGSDVCVGNLRDWSSVTLAWQLAQSWSNDWWGGRYLKLFLCCRTKTCLLDHGWGLLGKPLPIGFSSEKELRSSRISSSLSCGHYSCLSTDTSSWLLGHTTPGYSPPVLLAEPRFAINHYLRASHDPCAWESTAVWDVTFLGALVLDSSLCRLASLQATWRGRGGEWGAEPRGCCWCREEGVGVGTWQAGGREVSEAEVAAAELWERELGAGSTSSLRISRRFMLTLM